MTDCNCCASDSEAVLLWEQQMKPKPTFLIEIWCYEGGVLIFNEVIWEPKRPSPNYATNFIQNIFFLIKQKWQKFSAILYIYILLFPPTWRWYKLFQIIFFSFNYLSFLKANKILTEIITFRFSTFLRGYIYIYDKKLQTDIVLPLRKSTNLVNSKNIQFEKEIWNSLFTFLLFCILENIFFPSNFLMWKYI